MNGRKLHVLFVHNRYRSALPSGEDRVVDQECALLAQHGHRVGRFERRSDDIEAMSLLDKVRVPLQVPWNSATYRELRERLERERPDVVHVHNTFPLLSPAVLTACRHAGVPVVATLHNYYLSCPVGTLMRNGQSCTECARSLPHPALRHKCYRGSRLATVPLAVNTLVNRRRWFTDVDQLYCVSAAQRDILVSTGVPADKLDVRHHFVVDPGVRRVGPGRHALYLGRLTEDKGVPLLRKAWDELASKGGVSVPLVIAGDGPLRDEVRSWEESASDVRYVGLQDRDACRDLVADASVVIAPSRARETFGLVLVEAMASGVPVVAADHGGFRDLVQHEVTGLLHRPGDAGSLVAALHRVMSDPDTNVEMGTAGRKRYEALFSPEAGLRNLLAGYASVMPAAAPTTDIRRPDTGTSEFTAEQTS